MGLLDGQRVDQRIEIVAMFRDFTAVTLYRAVAAESYIAIVVDNVDF